MYTRFTSAKLEKSKSEPVGVFAPTENAPLMIAWNSLFALKPYFRNIVTSDCAVEFADARAKQLTNHSRLGTSDRGP